MRVLELHRSNRGRKFVRTGHGYWNYLGVVLDTEVKDWWNYLDVKSSNNGLRPWHNNNK
jgi:hypothetical protein